MVVMKPSLITQGGERERQPSPPPLHMLGGYPCHLQALSHSLPASPSSWVLHSPSSPSP